MQTNFFSSQQKIEKARGKVTKSLDVFRKAYTGVEVANGNLAKVVAVSDKNILDFQAKIQEEEATRLQAAAEIENNKQLLEKFSAFIPLSPK